MHVQFCLVVCVGRSTHGIEPVYMVHTVMLQWFFFFWWFHCYMLKITYFS